MNLICRRHDVAGQTACLPDRLPRPPIQVGAVDCRTARRHTAAKIRLRPQGVELSMQRRKGLRIMLLVGDEGRGISVFTRQLWLTVRSRPHPQPSICKTLSTSWAILVKVPT